MKGITKIRFVRTVIGSRAVTGTRTGRKRMKTGAMAWKTRKAEQAENRCATRKD